MEEKDRMRQSPVGWTTGFVALILFLVCTVLTYISISGHENAVARGGCANTNNVAGPCSTSMAASRNYFAGAGSGSISGTSSSMGQKQDVKLFPSMEPGGIVFFLHIPKTGGVSVRKALASGSGHYILSDSRRKFNKYKERMGEFCKYGTEGKVIVFELHASDSPSLMELSSKLDDWRTIAKQNNVPFFAFSVVREPSSMEVSFFNFYNGMDHDDPNYNYYEDPSEQDFVDNIVPDPQCGFLARGDSILYDEKEQQRFQPADCIAAYKTLHRQMDWVGTTATLSTETFPLLRMLIGSNANADHLAPENIKTKNKSPSKISQSNLSSQTIDLIHDMTRLDQNLYSKVKHDYPYARVRMENGNGNFR